jgi:hypothetical protein
MKNASLQSKYSLFELDAFVSSDCSTLPTLTHSFDMQYPQNPPQRVDFRGFGGCH